MVEIASAHPGLLEPGVGCLDDEREYRRETTLSALTCPDLEPPSLHAEYRTAWIGLVVGLLGSVPCSVWPLAGRHRHAWRTAFWPLSRSYVLVGGGPAVTRKTRSTKVAGWLLLVALAIVPLPAGFWPLVGRVAGRRAAKTRLRAWPTLQR